MGTGVKKTEHRPMISVIMGVYNQYDAEALRQSVESILNQTFTDFEFLIWDDGSEGEAYENVVKLKGLDPRIRVVGRKENHGLAFSLNGCIRIAKGTYIARMDADDISLPRRLEKQFGFLESNPEYGWCGTCAQLFDENGIWGERRMPKDPGTTDYFRFSPFIHPSVMFRASLFEEGRGYLETEEVLRCEDYEIFLHLKSRGQKGCNLQEPLFLYREDQTSYRKRSFHTRMNEAKMRYRSYKEMGALFPLGWMYVLRPVVSCLLPADVLAFIKRSQGMRTKKQIEAETEVVVKEAVSFEREERIPGAFGSIPMVSAQRIGSL